MKKLLLLSLLLISFFINIGSCVAKGDYPDENRKLKNGFSGLLIITPDLDWETKWNTPVMSVPHFKTTKEIRVGETATILTFFSNPLVGSDGSVNVLCKIKAVRANGTVAFDVKEIPCLKGKIKGDVHNIRLSPAIVAFVGEEKDPLGKWRVEVEITDVNRKTTLYLKNSFILKERGSKAINNR